MRTVTHLIIGLGRGGAETMLYNIVKHRTGRCAHRIVSLGASSFYEDRLRGMGVDVCVLNFRKHPFSSCMIIIKEARKGDILNSWMYHANLLSVFLKPFFRRPIVWNIRHSEISFERNKFFTWLIIRFSAVFSSFVSAIVYNGFRARDSHEKVGYRNENSLVMGNGVDTNLFSAVHDQRNHYYGGVKKTILLVVAKWSLQKDIPNFLDAFRLLKSRGYDVLGVLCGRGLDSENEEFVKALKSRNLELGSDICALGERDDIPSLMSSCDVFVLPSAGEAFPNVLIQAMACKCICVATDVGDVSRILRIPERVVLPKNSSALADKISVALSISPACAEQERLRNMKFICENFSIKEVVSKYEGFFCEHCSIEP